MEKMYLEGLWKHALHPLLLSVMFLLWCSLSLLLRWSLLCYTTPLAVGQLRFCFGTCCICYNVGLFCVFFLFYLQRFEHVFVFFITLLNLLFISFLFSVLYFKKKIYWTTWVVSLLVTISNGLVQFLNLHQQFVSYSQTKEKLLAQGWHYFELSGSYKNKSHQDNFIDF